MNRARRVTACVVGALLLGIGFVPLFGGPGYELTLAAGLVVPSAAAIAAALDLSARAGPPPPVAALVHGMTSGVVLAFVALATALLHGALRVGFCDLPGGVLYFALAAMPGAVLGGAWGAYVAERTRGRVRRRRLVSVLLALAAPLFSIGVGVWRFYASPMVFAFDPFVGYFSGTLYDTVVDAGTPLVTYRAGTACTLLGATLVASLLERDERGVLVPRARAGDATWGARFVVAVLALAASLLVTAFGPALGHWQTPATIARELGGRRAGARCDVVHADGLREDEIALLVKDCDEQLVQIEGYFGTHGPARVTAFFFKDAAQKKHLMGAGDTYIAKPWRREVYLQYASYPHPVLGHELAHVVAGSFGHGPFAIAGEVGGLLPNPGWIEGVAVAASPDEDELTDEAWAHAMLDLGILPRLEQVFGLGFLGQSSSKSYTVAGAFVRWMIAHHGVDRVRAVYGGVLTVEQATGKGWGQLDGDFRADIARVPLPPGAEAYARARFDRPAVFGRTCPHVVDALLHEADACREAHKLERAVELNDGVLRRDGHDWAAMYGRALARLRAGDEPGGRAELEWLAVDPVVPRTWHDRSAEALADRDWIDGRFDAAAGRYDALALRNVEEDAARTLEVKALGARDPAARRPLLAFLVATDARRGPEPLLGGELLGAWWSTTHDPLADYVLAKNFVNKQLYAEAAPRLARALAAGPPTVRLHREILRLQGVVACATGDVALVAEVRGALANPGSPFRDSGGGRLELLNRLLDRCAPAVR